MLTLAEVAKGFGLNITLQQVKNRIRKLEQETGRTILAVRGDGNGKRYLVNPDELALAMGEMPAEPKPASVDFDEVANRIADAVNAMNDRMQAMSERLYATQKELAEVRMRLGMK